jgi:hypothetical protein
MCAQQLRELPVLSASVADREEWERWFSQVPQPHFTQAWSYGVAKQRSDRWHVDRFLFLEGDRPVALCQMLVRRWSGLPLVARVNRGPLFLDASPSVELQWRVLRALRRVRRGLLLIAPALPADPVSETAMRKAGFMARKRNGWASGLIELYIPLETVRARASREWRKNLAAALKTRLELRIRNDAGGFEWMLQRHADNMRAKGFSNPPVDFVRELLAADAGDFRLFQACIDEEPCSALLVARFGHHAETYLSWTADEGRRHNAHTFLMWHAFVEMKRLGCRALDLGGYSTADRYGAYKRSLRGKEYRLAGEWLAL